MLKIRKNISQGKRSTNKAKAGDELLCYGIIINSSIISDTDRFAHDEKMSDDKSKCVNVLKT